MRKDKGLNGDLDRLPMLTWIMFLKFLDDLEIQREGEAKLGGKKFKAAIEPPCRWRDWAAKSDGIIQFEEFADCIAWWDKRKENERAWRVPAAELLANGCNLDRKNPRAKEDITHLPPAQLAADILKKEQRIAEIMGNIRNLLTKPGT